MVLEAIQMVGTTREPEEGIPELEVEMLPGFVGRAQDPGFEGEPSPSLIKGSLETTPGFIGIAQVPDRFEGVPGPPGEERAG